MATRAGETPGASRAIEDALAIYHAALDAVRADTLLRTRLHRDGARLEAAGIPLDLDAFDRVLVVGAGKAARAMAAATDEALGPYLFEGIVVTKHGHGGAAGRIQVLESAHPVPDAASVEAGRAIHALAQSAGPRDLVLCLLSGGASALMELPREGVTLEDLRATTDALLRAGAPIGDLNMVRACLSQLKAGGLARAASPARVLCLALSDVLGNPLGVIGSGPCVDQPVAPGAARDVLVRYGITPRPAVQSCLEQTSTPGAAASALHVDHVIVGDIDTALQAAAAEAVRRGRRSLVLTRWMQGEAREVARTLAGMARDLPRTRAETGFDCLLLGGETTVTVRGEGRGGRSQEMACAAAPLIAGVPDVALLAAGTDGTDGPTDAAGGLVDGGSEARARAAGLSVERALRESDSYPWLEAAGGLLRTGPTDSNVGDVVVIV